MQAATADSVLAPFNGERFTEGGVTSTFSQRDGKFYARTDGADGKLAEFQVTHTLGVAPLQQYLIPMPNGGLQALGIAWDARTRASGGQRWFHLLAGQHVKAGDDLHWTGLQQNWNFMCADCHTTQFKKNFDPDTRRYASSWAEGDVGCEACHGPGSHHEAWAKRAPGSAVDDDGGKGLALAFDERRDVAWSIDPASGNARRSRPPAAQRKEMEACARCHAHRAQSGDDYVYGGALLDTHLPSLLTDGLYWNDGQMRAEVFNTASFMQSKMYQNGVTCSDCHDPHSGKLRLPGNPTCLQCHAAAGYDAPSHHFHRPGSAGAQCAACHMPTTTYMTVDPRHDHSVRVPRPDLSAQRGTPNACNQCHADKSVQWAAGWARRRYPGLSQRATPLSDALYAADAGDPAAADMLLRLIRDSQQPVIARASAIARLPADIDPGQRATVLAGILAEREPLLRHAAIDALADAPAEQRANLLPPLLSDPVRGVRVAAARWLADVPPRTLNGEQQAQLAHALDEYIAIQRYNADRPESWNNLGTLYADQGDWARAEAALKTAIGIDHALALSSLNLADVYQHTGREAEAQALIEAVLKREPRNALAHHALGLSLLRQKRLAAALPALRQASRLDPRNARFAAVYALAQQSAGR